MKAIGMHLGSFEGPPGDSAISWIICWRWPNSGERAETQRPLHPILTSPKWYQNNNQSWRPTCVMYIYICIYTYTGMPKLIQSCLGAEPYHRGLVSLKSLEVRCQAKTVSGHRIPKFQRDSKECHPESVSKWFQRMTSWISLWCLFDQSLMSFWSMLNWRQTITCKPKSAYSRTKKHAVCWITGSIQSLELLTSWQCSLLRYTWPWSGEREQCSCPLGISALYFRMWRKGCCKTGLWTYNSESIQILAESQFQ